MIITHSVADTHWQDIQEIDEAFEIIIKLEGIFSKKGTCSIERASLKYICTTDMQDHFSKCDKNLSRD